jgi:hypothetical protein
MTFLLAVALAFCFACGESKEKVDQKAVANSSPTVTTSSAITRAEQLPPAATPSPSALSPQAQDAAKSAIKALRKMDAAAQVGVSYQEYGSRLIDTKAEVDEALSQIPEGKVKREIHLSMEAYTDANMAWSNLIDTGTTMFFTQMPPAPALIRKYSIPAKTSENDALDRQTMFTYIWKAARAHIDRAASLLDKQ